MEETSTEQTKAFLGTNLTTEAMYELRSNVEEMFSPKILNRTDPFFFKSVVSDLCEWSNEAIWVYIVWRSSYFLLLKILVHDVIKLLYYEHWTDKWKYFYVYDTQCLKVGIQIQKPTKGDATYQKTSHD